MKNKLFQINLIIYYLGIIVAWLFFYAVHRSLADYLLSTGSPFIASVRICIFIALMVFSSAKTFHDGQLVTRRWLWAGLVIVILSVFVELAWMLKPLLNSYQPINADGLRLKALIIALFWIFYWMPLIALIIPGIYQRTKKQSITLSVEKMQGLMSVFALLSFILFYLIRQ